MLESDELNVSMNGFDAIPEQQLAFIQHLIDIQHPQLLQLLNLNGEIQQYDPMEAFNEIAYPDGGYFDSESDDSDSTYVPSVDGDIDDYNNDEFDNNHEELHLHDPIILIGGQLYAGPYHELVEDPDSPCDCEEFNGNIMQCLKDNRRVNWLQIDFDEEFEAATEYFQSSERRETNSLQRKRMYGDIWRNLGNNIELEHDEATGRYARVRLPSCSYALVRMIWPSETGYYMGFLPQ